MARTKLIGFETGDASELPSLTSGYSISSGVGRYGNYALTMAFDNTTTLQNLATGLGLSRIRIRFALRYNGTFTGPQSIFPFYARTATDIAQLAIAMDSDVIGGVQTLTPYLYDTVDIIPGTNTKVFTGTDAHDWHVYELDATIGAAGAYTFKIDGVTIASGTANFTTSNTDKLQVGPHSGANVAGVTFDFDDFALDDAALPGIGGIIARQFLSTTPFYNSWIKSSGSTIDTVWNDTPFSAATYANSVFSEAIQSAVVSSFSAPQTDHGNGVITPTSTIHALLWEAIAKTDATTAAGISLIGTPQGGFSTAGADVTLSLTVGASAAAGDVVIVIGGHILRTGTSYGPAGYTLIGTLQTSGASGTGIAFGAWYKVMGATPDTTVVCQGSGTAGDGVAYTSRILRGVNTTTVLDAVATFAGPTTSTNPDPPSITPVTTGAAVVMGGGSLVSDTNIGGSTNYVSQATGNAAATRPYSTSSLHRLSLTGGVAENPPAIGSIGNAWASGIWFAVTIAIRPTLAAGSRFSALIRAGGSDNFSSIGLTTSDAFLTYILNTPPSLVNLNASEWGGYHGDTSALQTIEEVWAMVDYTAKPYSRGYIIE